VQGQRTRCPYSGEERWHYNVASAEATLYCGWQAAEEGRAMLQCGHNVGRGGGREWLVKVAEGRDIITRKRRRRYEVNRGSGREGSAL